MGDKRRVAERNAGAFIIPFGSGGAIATPANALFVGPGEPGPGDEWHMPPEEPEQAAKDEVSLEPVARVRVAPARGRAPKP